VIQKHDASHLHYDFRLELDGVLLSWAVPKGPSLDPSVKRLAMPTEDHPIAYRTFEGIIPEGAYGGGTVMVWDRGHWKPEGDPHAMMEKGHLTFAIEGDKLHGRWHLVKTKPRAKRDAWLLFKSDDEHASAKEDIEVSAPDSVKTGRNLDEIAAGRKTKKARSSAAIGHARKATSKSAPPAPDSTVTLTHLERVLYTDPEITKEDLAVYYRHVAERMLPHVANRPLTLVRCPNGVEKSCFFQKHATGDLPAAIKRIDIGDESGGEPYMMIEDHDGLIELVQLGVLEIHTWGCHGDIAEKPDFLVFDLDPDVTVPWKAVVKAAFEVKERLEALGLESWVKTTGGKGLHVCVPVARRIGWEETKLICHAFADAMVDDSPTRYVATVSKAKRHGKILIDYLRNARGATFIAPYSTRARDGAPVAMPLTWKTLESGALPALDVKTLLTTKLGPDPWAGIEKKRQSTVGAARTLLAKRRR
ncbi:MAG: non-homologous end-joining DNA ligase, partial [Polyangiaceae bacterium]